MRWRPAVAATGAGVAATVVARSLHGGAALAACLCGYAILVAVCAAARRIPGTILLATGMASNLVVMALDGGMPVAGLPPGVAPDQLHHGLSASDRFVFLADVIRIRPLHSVFSPGDCLVALGAVVAGAALLRPRRSPQAVRSDRTAAR